MCHMRNYNTRLITTSSLFWVVSYLLSPPHTFATTAATFSFCLSRLFLSQIRHHLCPHSGDSRRHFFSSDNCVSNTNYCVVVLKCLALSTTLTLANWTDSQLAWISQISPSEEPLEFVGVRIFTGCMPFLLPSRQCQSTEGRSGGGVDCQLIQLCVERLCLSVLWLWNTVQQLELPEDVEINVEDQMWAKRFASRHNFGFADSDDEDDWDSSDETYVVW